MKLIFVGDINLGEYYTSIGNGPKSYFQNNNPFSSCNKIFSEADAVIGNLESPVTYKKIASDKLHEMALIGDAKDISTLAKANFRYLQIANNHSIQHGEDVFAETIDALKANHITPLGLINQECEIFERNGVRVGLLCASDIPDNTVKNQTIYQKLDVPFIARIQAAVRLVDHLIVLLHWGEESSTEPLPEQRALAKKLKELGVRAIIGSHTHLFYEIENSENFLCAYSLGNFIFDLSWDKRLLQSGILEVTFSKEKFSACAYPITLTQNGCFPKTTQEPLQIVDRTQLYKHAQSMHHQQIKKMIYLLRNIFKGNTKLKFSFLIKKILKV